MSGSTRTCIIVAMRAARLILVAVAACAVAAALGTVAFAAASHDEPDLGNTVQVGSPTNPQGPTSPNRTPNATPEKGHGPGTSKTKGEQGAAGTSGPRRHAPQHASDDDDDDDEGATRATTSPRHAGDDDDEGDADDDHDEDGDGD